VGMNEQVKSRLFEPFFTTKEPGHGTGLGLPGVHGIVKQSQGHIEVYSELGLGSTFKIYLPAVPWAETGEPTAESAAWGPVSSSNGSGTILLVEDEPALRNVTRVVLQKAGYAVLAAGNGAEALQIAEGHDQPIDLLVTDVVMPEMGGRAVAERLVETRPGIKVLYLSGYPADAVVRHGILHDSVYFMQKPFSIIALSRKVHQIIAGE
jgi:two-component system, cell cycle sensor histidine kinase and response regulator CckA